MSDERDSDPFVNRMLAIHRRLFDLAKGIEGPYEIVEPPKIDSTGDDGDSDGSRTTRLVYSV